MSAPFSFGDVPDPVEPERPLIVDQLCIDIQGSLFDEETAFWTALTNWERRAGALDEFACLVRPRGIPLRLLFQRLGDDDAGPSVRAHLDLACGCHIAEIAAKHRALAAEYVGAWKHWTALRDPAGLPYCPIARGPS